jgi:hypothetical protein
MDRDQAHKLIDQLFDMAQGETPEVETQEIEKPEKVLPESKKVVRTKSSGDRVYYIDEEKKTRQWVTNPDVLTKLGFDMDDVTEVDDSELLSYSMAAALYRVENDS